MQRGSTISVADSNDNSPIFEQSSYVIHLLENSPVGSLLIDLNATDADDGTNAKIIYSFSSHVSPKIVETFKINSDNGHLTLMKRVDFESATSYDIDVQAQDMGPNSMPAHCKIFIKVVDINDNKPDISINLMSQGDRGKEDAAYISEAAPLDSFVALVRVEDLDSALNGEVVCKLHGQGSFKLQKTYENNYMILTNVSLDREKRSEFSLTVIAEDRGTPSLSTIKHFTVHVLDENDNAPRFQKGRYEVFRSENNAPGAYLTSLLATDPDLDANSQVSYFLVENTVHGSSISTFVTIDPSNGAVYALRTFDREDVSRISFVVQAKDAGEPSLLSNATVVLNDPGRKRQPAGHRGSAALEPHGRRPHLQVHRGRWPGYGRQDQRQRSLRRVSLEFAELTVLVSDHGSLPQTTKAVLKISLYENMEGHVQVLDQGETPLERLLIIIMSLGAICAMLLVIMVMFAARFRTNCRVAETNHQHHPKKPSRAHHRSPSATPPMDRAPMGSRQSHHSHQSLNSLVTISSNHIPESFALELATQRHQSSSLSL
uniref:Protocadherin 18a n=1 Tax=Salmo trutta TaxID=8032 RepID=A0A673ZXN7_SALTR